MRTRITLAMIAAITVLAGCGGGTSGPQAVATPSIEVPGAAPAKSTAEPVPPLTKAQAERALLKVSDLPAAWVAVEAAPGDVVTSLRKQEIVTPKEQCDGLAGQPFEATDLAAASFVSGELSKGTYTRSTFQQRTYDLDGGQPPSARLDLARASLDTCTTYTLSSSITRETSSWRVQALPFPDVGDGTVAWRAFGREAFGGYTTDYVTDNVVVSVRGVVMRFTARGIGTAALPGSDLADLVAAAVSRAQNVGAVGSPSAG